MNEEKEVIEIDYLAEVQKMLVTKSYVRAKLARSIDKSERWVTLVKDKITLQPAYPAVLSLYRSLKPMNDKPNKRALLSEHNAKIKARVLSEGS